LPARLLGKRETGGAVEIVLLRSAADVGNSEFGIRNSELAQNQEYLSSSENIWECLVRPGKKIRIGTALVFGNGELTAIVIGETDGGNRLVKFEYDESSPAAPLSKEGDIKSPGGFLGILERLGKMPLPPYIHEELLDSERYQTVYSKVSGSAAAPTAGLHFTNELLSEIRAGGVEICYITLHVGLGTFRPVKTDMIEEHKMHAEYFIIPGETAEAVSRAKNGDGRVIAVGTTSCRALEACSDESGSIGKFSGFTDIFIYPGYKFKCIDGLITNFHLPESTLIMLVSAFAGREHILKAYDEAIRERYRFFSFGDAMAIM